jgi:hypothetical protein
MYWVIRWTDAQTEADKAIVVEARSRAEAEYMGLKRGIPIVSLSEASGRDVAAARKAKLLWKYTPAARYTCFGRPLDRMQVAALLLAGVATASLHLGPIIPQIVS